MIYEADVIRAARRWSLSEFKDRKHGNLPYEVHNTAVAGLVATYTRKADVIAAAWLHDIVEDHRDQYDVNDVIAMTNSRVGHLVDLLTDDEGPRRLVKQKSLARISQDVDAILIKLCDRYTNQHTTIVDQNIGLMKMYVREFPEFRAALFEKVAHREEWALLLNGLVWQFKAMSGEIDAAVNHTNVSSLT